MEEGEAALRSGRGPLVSANEDLAGIAEFPSMTMRAVVVGVAGAGGQLGVVGPDPDLMAVLTRSGCPVRVVPGGLLAANLAEVRDVADIFSSNGSIISNISHQLVYDGIFFATVSFPTDCFFIEVFSQNYSLAASQNLSFVLSLVFHRPHVRSFCYLLRFLLCHRRADTLIT